MGNRIWIWFEDELISVSDIRNYLDIKGINYVQVANFEDLYKKLIDFKNQNRLSEIGLILDVKIDACKRIPLPKEWTGKEPSDIIRVNNNVNDTGLVFYEYAILKNAEVFKKNEFFFLPPVIFLSTVPNVIFEAKIEDLKNMIMKIDPGAGDCITYIRKWDYQDSDFLNKLMQ